MELTCKSICCDLLYHIRATSKWLPTCTSNVTVGSKKPHLYIHNFSTESKDLLHVTPGMGYPLQHTLWISKLRKQSTAFPPAHRPVCIGEGSMRVDSGKMQTTCMDKEVLGLWWCLWWETAFLQQMVQAWQCVGLVKKHMVLSRWCHTPAPGPVGGVNASLHAARVSGTVDITSKNNGIPSVNRCVTAPCEFSILFLILTNKPLQCITTTDNKNSYKLKHPDWY